MCMKFQKEPRRGRKKCGMCTQCSRAIVSAAAKRDRRLGARLLQRDRIVKGIATAWFRSYELFARRTASNHKEYLSMLNNAARNAGVALVVK